MSKWQARIRKFSMSGYWEDRGSDGKVFRGELSPGTQFLEFLESLDPADVYAINVGIEVWVYYRVKIETPLREVPYGWELITEGYIEKGDMTWGVGTWCEADKAIGRPVAFSEAVIRKIPIPQTWELITNVNLFVTSGNRVRYEGSWLTATDNVVGSCKRVKDYQAVIQRRD